MTDIDTQTYLSDLARALGETKRDPIAQLRRIIERCGVDQTQAWLAQTEVIEANGGEMLTSGKRRRTKGGVFFKIVRTAVTGDDRQYIFPGVGNGQKTEVPALPTATWADRNSLIKEANQQQGKAMSAKITVIGKIGKAVERSGFTLITMQHDGKLPALPKGIPVPTQALPTNYIVYIGGRQWSKIKDSLKNPEDVLIAEGIPVIDPKYSAVSVFVTNATTKLLQAAQREAQKADKL